MLKYHLQTLLLLNSTATILFLTHFAVASEKQSKEIIAEDYLSDDYQNYNDNIDNTMELREYIEQQSIAFQQLKLDTLKQLQIQATQSKKDKMQLEEELALIKKKLHGEIKNNELTKEQFQEEIELNAKRLGDFGQNIVTQLNSGLENATEQMSNKIELVNGTFEKKNENIDKQFKVLEQRQIYSEFTLLPNISNHFGSQLKEFNRNMSTELKNVTDEIIEMKSKFGIMESRVKLLEVNQSMTTNQKGTNWTTNANQHLSYSNSINSHVKFSLEACGGTITSYPQAIVKYPARGTYSNNLDCTWKVERPPGVVFVVQALSINLERYDHVWVRANGRCILSWKSQNFHSVLTHSNKFELKFVTDGNFANNGFVIKWTAMKIEDTCKGNIFQRFQCAHIKITKRECEALGCCWDSTYSDAYNCFYQQELPAT